MIKRGIIGTLFIFNLFLGLNIKSVHADTLTNGRYSISGREGSILNVEEGMPYVYSNYEKTANFLLYNSKSIYMYEGPSKSSGIVSALAPQMVQATKRKGDWFLIKTWMGDKWIYWDDDVEMYEIEVMANTEIVLNEECVLHTNPFDVYATDKKLSAGTYSITKKSMDWYLTDKGWIKSINVKFKDVKAKLDVDQVMNVPIKQRWAVINEKIRPGYTLKPLYITIHNTANTGYGATAAAHANLLYENSLGVGNYISWHFSVDDKEIYQSIPLNEVAWHAGDGDCVGNRSTIAIEICENIDGDYKKAEENAVYLTAQLLKEYNLKITDVKAHKDFSGKNCPSTMYATTGWDNFIKRVGIVLEELKKNDEQNNNTGEEDSKEEVSKPSEPSEPVTPQKMTYLDIGLFVGEQNVNKAYDKLKTDKNWYMNVVKTNESVGVYRVVTGGFKGESEVKAALDRLVAGTGWWATYEPKVNQPGYYRIVTGGFVGQTEVNNALNKLKSVANWWATYEDTGRVQYKYRIITGGMPENVGIENSKLVAEKYGWYNILRYR